MVLVVCADLSFKVVVLYRLVIFVLVWTPSPQRHLLDFSPLSFCLFCLLGGDLCVGFGVGSLRRHQAGYREAASEGGRVRVKGGGGRDRRWEPPLMPVAAPPQPPLSPLSYLSLIYLLPLSYISPTSLLPISYLFLTSLSLSHTYLLPLPYLIPRTEGRGLDRDPKVASPLIFSLADLGEPPKTFWPSGKRTQY